MRAGELQDNITVEDYVVMVCPMYTYDWYKNMMIPYMHTTDPHHIIGVKSITGQISSEDITYHIFALCKIN